MAGPRDCLGAHHRDPLLGGQPNQGRQSLSKFPGLHVVGEASERFVSPPKVLRLSGGAAEPTEPAQVNVPYPRLVQRTRQAILVELGIVSRSWDCAHIGDAFHTVALENSNEILYRPRRMADRKYRQRSSGAVTMVPRSHAMSNGRVPTNR